MKTKLFFLLLFIPFCAGAQIVNIPDANFKAALLSTNDDSGIRAKNMSGTRIIINANGDNEIQQSEADAVHYLEIYIFGIWDITGVNSFTNLKTLEIRGGSNMALVDIQGLQFLNKFILWDSSGLNGMVNLQNLPALSEIDYNSNSFDALTISNAPLLKKITVVACGQIDSFVTSTLPGLEELYFESASLASADFSKFPNLKKIDFSSGAFNAMNLTGLNLLVEFNCIDCYLESLTIPDLPVLKKIVLEQVVTPATLNIGALPQLTDFSIGAADIASIDLSGCPLLDKLKMSVQDVDFINLKNGKITYSLLDLDIGFMSGVSYICVDEGEEALILSESITNAVVANYCSFTPGGNYNSITGTTTFDIDNNGCDTDDVFQGLMKVKMNDGTNTSYTFTNNLSQYKFYTQAGSFTLTPEFENNWFTATPATATVNFANNNNNTSTNNFCITSVGSHPDVEVVVYPITAAQPGFDAWYKVVYKNKGNLALSGAVTFNYDDAVLDLVTATPAQSSAATGQLTFNYTNLLPFEDREIIITLNLNGPMETPPLNNGDDLNFSVAISPTAGDETPADNTFSYEQEIVGSYDPNDIVCLEGDMVSPADIGEYLHYVVNFENTGTAPTSFIVVRVDVNPAQYDISSLRVLNTSHASDIRVNGNRIEFMMPSAVLAAGDHGNILFKMKSKSNLVEGDIVKKKANIYFDYNFPIVTNDANTTFQTLSTGNWAKDDSVKVYPNPSAGMVNIEASSAISSIELYDVQGRLVEVQKSAEMNISLDITTRAKGIYFVKIITERGVKVEKIVRQ